MYMLKVTIAATNTAQRIIGKSPVIDNSNTAFQIITLQNNCTNNMYIGDSAVSSTNGTDSSGNPYVEVTVVYPFTTISNYPGLPNPINLTRTVRMRVAPATPN